MTDLIQRIVVAIFRQEGMSQEYVNPGNLRSAPWLSDPVIHNGFWVPVSRNEGIAGAVHVVALHIAMGHTLTQLIYSWAPPSENKTSTYLHDIKDWAKISDEHVPLWNYL